MPDIVEIIKEQHRQVDDLLTQAEQEGSDKAALLQEVARMLLPHSEAEEDFVYPTIRRKAEEAGEDVEDGQVEHHQIEQMLQDLLNGSPDDPGYDGTIAAIAGELRHHVQEEEEQLLPILEQNSSAEEREEMGRRFLEATTRDLPTGSPEGHSGGRTKHELYEQAKEQHIAGRSKMSKEELADALGEAAEQ